jgi:osmotically-inducible protein OsmY
MKSRILGWFAACAMVVGVGVVGCQPQQQPGTDTTVQTEQQVTDQGASNTANRIHSALMASTEVGATDMDVVGEGTTIYLRGYVESEEQRTRAEQIARQQLEREESPGLDIVNELRIRG